MVIRIDVLKIFFWCLFAGLFIWIALAFGIDYVLMAGFFFCLPVIIILNKNKLFFHFLLCVFFGIGWMAISKGSWSSSKHFISLFGYSLAPFFAWVMALFLGYLLYHYLYSKKMMGKPPWKRTFYFFICAFPITFVISNSTFIGLTICECIKSATWLKILMPVYVLVYFGVSNILGLEKD